MIAVLFLMALATCPQLSSPACPKGTQLERRDAPDDAMALVCVDGRGVAQGPWVEHNRDQTVWRAGSYREGEPDGVWVTYDCQGLTSEMGYAAGARAGVFFVRSPRTRRIVQSGAYRRDLPDGVWHWFAEDGTLLGSSVFTAGTGELLFFDTKGVKFRSVRLVEGSAVEEIRYGPGGKVSGRLDLSAPGGAGGRSPER